MSETFDFRTLEDISAYSKEFANRRNWQEFQTPKNLTMALSVECSELLEHFQWLTEQESLEISGDKKREVSHEMADVLFYLVRIADVLNIDLYQSTGEKALLNEIKYPVA